MEKTAYELGYLEALEKLGMIPPLDPMTKEAAGRMRGIRQAIGGIFGGQGRQVAMSGATKSQGPGMLRRGWDRLTKGRNVTLPPSSATAGAARSAPKAQASAASAAPKQTPTPQATSTQAPTPQATSTQAPTQQTAIPAPATAAKKEPGFLRRKAIPLAAGAAAGGAYGLHKWDQYANEKGKFKRPTGYYSQIPGGEAYRGY